MDLQKKFVDNLLFEKECYFIIGKAMKVHSILKRGFKEIVYKDAMELEFIADHTPYVREKPFSVSYIGNTLRHSFDADFFLFNSIIVEIKATHNFHYDHFEQTLNYLRASGVQLGLLINFAKKSLEYKRVICTV